MAVKILLRHPETGIVKQGFHGFSWTTLFFAYLPPLFRGDAKTFFGTFLVATLLYLPVIIGFISSSVASQPDNVQQAAVLGLMWLTHSFSQFFLQIIWAFKYNKYYTCGLIEQGYLPADTPSANALAAAALSIVTPVEKSQA